MIALKVEKIGDQVAVVLNAEAQAALHVTVGDTLQLELGDDGALSATSHGAWIEDPHARGRAFLRRYNRSFDQR